MDVVGSIVNRRYGYGISGRGRTGVEQSLDDWAAEIQRKRAEAAKAEAAAKQKQGTSPEKPPSRPVLGQRIWQA